MKRKVLPSAFRPLDWLPVLPESLLRGVLAVLARCEQAVPVDQALVRFIEARRPDAVLVSPLIDAASEQVDVVKAARRLGVPVGACIASWDNLTNKGLLRVQPDLVTVWNEAQRTEAVRFHGASPDRVVATGAQLFDRWFERRPGTTRADFCRQVGLPDERRFVLFTGSSSFIAETQREVAFVREWIAALRCSGEGTLADLGVLVRPHPYNYYGWLDADLGDGTAVWPRGPYNPIDEGSRALYYDSLYHAAAVVGLNTSAMLEAAIVGRPVLSIVTPDFSSTQDGTLHFHHLLVEHGGCVTVAHSLPQHVGQLQTLLDDPGATASRTRAFVERFVRPHGLDLPATPILVQAIEALAAGGRQAPVRDAWWAWPARGAMLAVAAYAGSVSRLSDRRWRGRLRKRLQQVSHRLRKRTRRLRSRRTSWSFVRPHASPLLSAARTTPARLRAGASRTVRTVRRAYRQSRFRVGTWRQRLHAKNGVGRES